MTDLQAQLNTDILVLIYQRLRVRDAIDSTYSIARSESRLDDIDAAEKRLATVPDLIKQIGDLDDRFQEIIKQIYAEATNAQTN